MARTAERPTLAQPRAATLQEAPFYPPARWDPDAYHAMEQRDDALIQDEILNGVGSSSFVYSFPITGQKEEVSGISVIGARQLASYYGGIKHRIVASAEKRGKLFTFTSYPAENVEMRVSCSIIEELEHEPDFFKAVVELSDIKTGNTIQVERSELRFEKKKDGSFYERPNFSTIAQSKAYRNGVLSLIEQGLQIEWKHKMLALGKGVTITESILEQKRSNVIAFAAARAVPLDRRAVEVLTLDQIAGLGDAAREGALPAFVQAAQALGLLAGTETGEVVQETKPSTDKKTTPAKAATASKDAPPPPAETTDGKPTETPEQSEDKKPATEASKPTEDHPAAAAKPTLFD